MNQDSVSNGVSTFHFDFHKNIACPKLSCQEYYYSSKLTTYAFGVYSGETGKGSAYIWPETVAPKHPDSLVSCIDYHLKETEDANRRWNIFWADNTRSQNKNLTVAMYFDNLVSSGERDRIDYKFLIAGHSFGQVDRNCGLCEGVLKKEETIETPSDFVNLINRNLSPEITWFEMKQNQFYCYSKWLRTKYADQRKDIYGHPYRFSDMVWFNFGIGERIDATDGTVRTFRHPGVVWMRETLDPREEPTEVDLRNPQHIELNSTNLRPLNRKLIPLTKKKREDLKNLTKFLSPRAKTYYGRFLGR